MIRVACQRFLAVGNGAGEVAAREPHGGALVPTFGELRLSMNHASKKPFRFFEPAILHRVDAGTKQPVGFRIPRAAPGAPKKRLRRGGKLGIVALQRLERFMFRRGIHESPSVNSSSTFNVKTSNPKKTLNFEPGT